MIYKVFETEQQQKNKINEKLNNRKKIDHFSTCVYVCELEIISISHVRFYSQFELRGI